MGIYCSGSDIIALALPIAALRTIASVGSDPVARACQTAGDYSDAFFRGRWGYTAVPLLTWDTSITRANAQIAAYWLMRGPRGLDPSGKEYQLLRDEYKEAVDYLDKIQRQQAHPLVTLSNANAPGAVQPNLVTSSVVNLSNGAVARNRGW
jgi:phage gp36-like protein